MIDVTPALSLTNSITKVGALAGFAALLGIALLSLLYFSQAREVRRLREWAARAPERAAELEQRVAADLAARAQRAAFPPRPGATPGMAGVRAVAVAGQASRTVPDGVPPAQPVVAGADGAIVPLPTAAQAAPAVAPAPASIQTAEPGEDGASLPAGAPAPLAAPAPATPAGALVAAADASLAAEAPPATPSATGPAAAPPSVVPGGTPSDPWTVPEPNSWPSPASPGLPAAVPAPSASPLPGLAPPSIPSVLAPPPPATAAATARAAGAIPRAPSLLPSDEDDVSQEFDALPPSRRASSLPAPPRSRRPAAGSRGGRQRSSRRGSGPLAPIEPHRPVGQMLAMAGAAVVGIVIVVVLITSVFGGGGGKSKSSTASSETTAAVTKSSTTPVAPPVSVASNPATLAVAVINSTTITGLARSLSGDLNQKGYTASTFLQVQPPTASAISTVYYAPGHRADAQGVAHALGLTAIAPINPATRALAGTATVVVVAGTDEASAAPGGGGTATGL